MADFPWVLLSTMGYPMECPMGYPIVFTAFRVWDSSSYQQPSAAADTFYYNFFRVPGDILRVNLAAVTTFHFVHLSSSVTEQFQSAQKAENGNILHGTELMSRHSDSCRCTRTPKSKDISRQNLNFHRRTVLATFTSMTVLQFPLRAHKLLKQSTNFTKLFLYEVRRVISPTYL
jgi:hypothetical protein